MDFKKFLIDTKENLLNMLYPKNIKCIFCGRDILNFDKQPYCDECAKEKIFNVGNRCMYCDVKIPDDNIVCDFCKKRKKTFEKAYCPLIYKDDAKKAILRFKSDNARYLAKPFAKLICDRITADNIKIDIVIPVPVHAKTRRVRGYNQSEVLATEIAEILNVPMLASVVTKDKVTIDQKTLPYHDRLKNVEECFTLRDKEAIKDKNVLIVDDVMTTGSTLNAVSRTLAGYSNHVYVSAIARDMVE